MSSAMQEPRNVYQRLRAKFGGYAVATRRDIDPLDSVPFGEGRDPGSFLDAMDTLASSMGWDTDLARADVMEQWADIVGPEVALHALPVGASGGVMEIQCDSSAWATQLRLMRSTLLESLIVKFPDASIVELSIKAPGAPSWKHGRRSVPGRGPRDTYG